MLIVIIGIILKENEHFKVVINIRIHSDQGLEGIWICLEIVEFKYFNT